jgi:hypothetical protein
MPLHIIRLAKVREKNVLTTHVLWLQRGTFEGSDTQPRGEAQKYTKIAAAWVFVLFMA